MSEFDKICTRKLGKTIQLLLGTVVILSLGFTAIWIQPASALLSSWSSTTNYPIGIEFPSCVMSSGFVYCIAGENTTALPGGGVQGTINSAVYFAPLSSSGVGSWSPTTSYPTGIVFQSCVVNSGFVYCIGGDMANGFGTANGFTNVVYFAPLSSSGVGSWSSGTSYPLNVISPSCVVGSGFAYCIGGDTATHSPFGGTFTGFTSAVYFASLSSSGVGSSASTTSYPTVIYTQSCALDSGYVYCIGGSKNSCGPLGTSRKCGFFASTSPNTTSTSISCSPSSVAVNQPTQCTATV